MTPSLKIVVERHADGCVAVPFGLARGAVIGQGDPYEAALSDLRSALSFHIETFGTAPLAFAEDASHFGGVSRSSLPILRVRPLDCPGRSAALEGVRQYLEP